MMNYVIAFGASFVSVFFKGFQHKNVINNMYLNAGITSYFMAVTDVLLISTIAKSGWDIAFTTGSGAALGIVCAMYSHNKFFKQEEK